jgi:hypothetical protein
MFLEEILEVVPMDDLLEIPQEIYLLEHICFDDLPFQLQGK